MKNKMTDIMNQITERIKSSNWNIKWYKANRTFDFEINGKEYIVSPNGWYETGIRLYCATDGVTEYYDDIGII